MMMISEVRGGCSSSFTKAAVTTWEGAFSFLGQAVRSDGRASARSPH